MRSIWPILAIALLAACTIPITAPLTEHGNPAAPGFGPTGPLPEAGHTLASSSDWHGIPVSYFRENEAYAIWHPGNRRALLGTWRRGRDGRYCYSYTVNTFNPATGSSDRAGDESCNPTIGDGIWVAKVPGDVFALRSGRVPDFDLGRCRLPAPLVLLADEPYRPQG